MPSPDPRAPFDFDRWRQLAEDDPEAFFRARRLLLEAYIEARPHLAPQLRELQGQIDALRASAGSPLVAARQIAGLMEDHLEAMSAQIEALREEARRLRGMWPKE